MAQHDTLAFAREDHVMLAHDVATAHRSKADVTPGPRPGDAITPRVAHCVQGHAAPCRRSLAQHQGSARWRIHLHAVMRLDHLDVPVGVQRLGHQPGHPHQQVQSQAHVAGAHDHRVMRGQRNGAQMLCLQPCGADHMHGTGLGGQRRKLHRRGWRGEIDHRLRLREGFQRVVGHHDPQRCPTHRLAHITPDPGGAGPFDAAHEPRLVGRQDGPDQHLAHPARCPGHDDSRQVGHAGVPQK